MKIVCIGRNYAAHARELKNEVPGQPVIFLKPDTAVPQRRMPFFLPAHSRNVHYEVELVIRIERNGKNIAERFARKYYKDITVGIDFTARDLQDESKKKGLPWEPAKAFDGSAPVGTFIPIDTLDTVGGIDFRLLLNGAEVQHGNSRNMLFSFDRIIAYVSSFITLKEGDLVFTGTPEGVGPVADGDKLEAFIGNKKLLTVNVR